MSRHQVGDSTYTITVKSLADSIEQNVSAQDSLYGQARELFQTLDAQQKAQNGNSPQGWVKHHGSRNNHPGHNAINQKRIEQQLQQQRDDTYSRWHKACESILDLIEGPTPQDTQRKSARLLSTILLVSRPDNNKPTFYAGRHIYRATLSILLLEQMLEDGHIDNSYILQMANKRLRRSGQASQCPFRNNVQLPLIMAALLQDVGSCHPEAQKLIKAINRDEMDIKPVCKEKRLKLKKLNYRFRMQFLTYGLGLKQGPQTSWLFKDEAEQQAREKLGFIKSLLHGATCKPGSVSDLIRLPEMYSALLMSKHCSYQSLPNIALVMQHRASRGLLGKPSVECLLRIIGHFPPGYGIAYIPKHDNRYDMDRYEYAIVTGLYPESPKKPRCRGVTRNLKYTPVGQDILVDISNNLYFPKTRKKLEKVSGNRLQIILSKLSRDHHKLQGVIPSFWLPYDYFSYSKHQNLWSLPFGELNAA